MISLHHAHLMATDINATIAFWTDGFDGKVVLDVPFAGARNVLITVGAGRIHLYEQPPKVVGQGTVHHLGVVDDLDAVATRLRSLGVSVRDVRHEFAADYKPAQPAIQGQLTACDCPPGAPADWCSLSRD